MWLFILMIFNSISSQAEATVTNCYDAFYRFKEPTEVAIQFPGIQVAQVQDRTRSTGATLLYFPRGAYGVADERGGSVATIETSLLAEGSYVNYLDGLVFAGGSTLGLAATDGVRQEIFRRRLGANPQPEGIFDAIPAVPGAVVFDYGGRIYEGNRLDVYPNREMGVELYRSLSSTHLKVGRAGAGLNTRADKRDEFLWGGQGWATRQVRLVGRDINIAALVVLNPGGNVFDPNGERYSKKYTSETNEAGAKGEPLAPRPSGPGENTTLSAILVDIPMSRSQLKRIAISVHTGMGASIRPFQTSTDGDVLFAVSTGGDDDVLREWGAEMAISEVASELMQKAIETAIASSNWEREL